MSNAVHENERYVVLVADYDTEVKSHGCIFAKGYKVLNKETGVAEIMTPQLPDAIFASEQMNMVLEQKQWEWISQTNDQVNPDGSPVTH